MIDLGKGLPAAWRIVMEILVFLEGVVGVLVIIFVVAFIFNLIKSAIGDLVNGGVSKRCKWNLEAVKSENEQEFLAEHRDAVLAGRLVARYENSEDWRQECKSLANESRWVAEQNPGCKVYAFDVELWVCKPAMQREPVASAELREECRRDRM